MRLNRDSLYGVIPAVITPFTGNYELNLEGLKTILNFLIENGVHGIMTTGGNGEFPHLLLWERKRVLEVAREVVPSKIPLIACVSACSVIEVMEYIKHAEDVGADGIILTPPYYYKLQKDMIVQFYKDVSERTELPIIVYNNPTYTKHNIDPDSIEEIVKIENVIGMKQSNSDLGETMEIIRRVGNKIAILTGIDSQFYATLCIGGKGVFSTAACVIPGLMVKLYELTINHRVKEAYELNIKLQELFYFFEYEHGYVTPCKEALNMMGFPAGPVRKPLPQLTEIEKEALRSALKKLGLIK